MNSMPKSYRMAALMFLAWAVITPIHGQDGTRHIWDTGLLAPQSKTEKAPGQSSHRPRYTVLTPKVPLQNVDSNTVLGITLWRLRTSKVGDAGERLLVHEGGQAVELEPRRVSARTVFQKNDKVRITVEAAREGYLYVVDQERYSNGKLGEPYLIFPLSTIRGGQNHLLPGQVVEIPAQDDDPPYWSIKKSRPDHVGERLTLLVANSPLDDIQPPEKWQRLSREQYAQWEKNSQLNSGIAEMTGTTDATWSKDEKNAGLDSGSKLGADSPRPQTLFYGPRAGADAPTVVRLVLNYAQQVR